MDIKIWIIGARKGARDCQKMLFNFYSLKLLEIGMQFLSREDAEERMLDVFYKFFTGIRDFEYLGEKELYGWLSNKMVWECLVFKRDSGYVPFLDESCLMNEPVEPLANCRLASNEIFELIHQLPDGFRIVFVLYALYNFSHGQIAEALHISENTSKSQLTRAKKYLQKKLIKLNPDYETRKRI